MHLPLLAALSLACARAPAPAPEAGPAGGPAIPAAPVTAEAPAAAARRVVVLDPTELSYDEAAGTVTFHPDSRRQSAEYTHYVLDLDSLVGVLGARPDAPVEVVIEVTGGETRTEVPDDPNMPQPLGGFQITTWTGRVVGRGG